MTGPYCESRKKDRTSEYVGQSESLHKLRHITAREVIFQMTGVFYRAIRSTVFFILVFMLFPDTGYSAEMLNPHQGRNCGSCHVGEPSMGPDNQMDYRFLAEDIDPTCMICHVEKCCSIGEEHLSHPSAIDTWDQSRYGVPKDLPLQDGHITCVTCHFWRRELNTAPDDYKLVRMVTITTRSIDWTNLCKDCHKGY